MLKTSFVQNINHDSLVGMFGHPVEGEIWKYIVHVFLHFQKFYHVSYTGDVEISLRNGTLYFRYGLWAIGYLDEYPNITNTYIIRWDSDFVHDIYFGIGYLIDIFVQFENADTLSIVFDDVYIYRRGVSLETLPEIPWEPESCGPSD